MKMKKDDLNISYQEFKNVIDNLHDEIMIFDHDYKLIYLNEASIRHYGLSPKNLIGKRFDELDDVYWGNSTLPEVYETKQIVAKRQITNLGNDILTISVPIFDENNSLKYVAQNVNDIYYINEINKAEEKSVQVSKNMSTLDDDFVYKSDIMQEFVSTIDMIKDVSSPCLILGETGTGKSHIARYMHNHSKRKKGPFVAVNCGCMNPNLIESELFGYRKGAFSGASNCGKKGIVEIANGGTLFLDEISEIPYDLQSKLLLFIQEQKFIPLGCEKEHHVDVKIIAATNRSLQQMVENKSFREDLYFRLNVFEVTIPPLRERNEDVEILANHFLEIYNHVHKKAHVITREAMKAMEQYSWPGNIRELSHLIEKIVVLTNHEEITIKDLPKTLFQLVESKPVFRDMSLNEILEDVEKKVIIEAYQKHKSSVQVAKALNISQPKAYRLIQKYVIK